MKAVRVYSKATTLNGETELRSLFVDVWLIVAVVFLALALVGAIG